MEMQRARHQTPHISSKATYVVQNLHCWHSFGSVQFAIEKENLYKIMQLFETQAV